ncbi:MAG: response regulator transcription factor [Vicinamibacterales bacterium]
MGYSILLIEDEPEMQLILRDNLKFEGYEILAADTGERGVEMGLSVRPDLVLLDVILPRMSGYEVCQRLRDSGFDSPIIMITARNHEIDRISGLEFGADDYVAKPFSVPELMARVRAQLRAQLRRRQRLAAQPAQTVVGDLQIDTSQQKVRRGSVTLDLSSREFDLLMYFLGHRGEVVTREQLLSDVWGYPDLPLTRTVDNFVAKLRKKIEIHPHKPRYIVTIHGTGYRFMK